MAVTPLVGDLFTSDAQTLVNTVNCVGVMGKGIALEFKQRFPDMFKDYEQRCRRKEVRLGVPYLYRSLVPPWVLNFPTKDHWRSVSRMKDIVRGLEYLEAHYQDWGIESLAVPPLGCGSGQLEWEVVGPVLYDHLSRLRIPTEVYAPHGTPCEQRDPEFLSGRQSLPRRQHAGARTGIGPAWTALIEILARIQREPYHWAVGRTTFQKIAYVATTEGLPTGLEHRKGSYGPFAPDLKRQVTKLVNHGLLQEERQGSMFAVQVGPAFSAARSAHRAQLQAWEAIIQKVSDLFTRINTQEAEMVATVIFSARELAHGGQAPIDEMAVLAHVMDWKQKRRPQWAETDAAHAIRNLAALGWLDVRPSAELPLPRDALCDY